MAKNRQASTISPAEFIELTLLRLAAVAVDLRGLLAPHEAAENQRLGTVLDACESLFDQLGWGEPAELLANSDKAEN